MKRFIAAQVFVLALSLQAFSSEDHDAHGDEKPHSEKEEHGHEESKNESIGVGKGIVSADEKDGFQISPEAEKNFEIKRVKLSSVDLIKVPKAAIITAGVEINIYRYRSGHYKRIDFIQIKKAGGEVFIKSKDLEAGDEIVVVGMGLLRIAELAAFGGAPEGHSH